MPAKVQTHNQEPYQYDKVHEPPIHNKNWVHKEALQIALGSILTPKRPHYASSRSTSGTLSPSHTSGTGTPVHPHAYHHAYHYPSRLSQTSSGESSPTSHPSSPTSAKQPMSFTEADDALRVNTAPTQQASTNYAYAHEPPPSPGLGPIDDSDPRLKRLRPTFTPLQETGNAASHQTGIPMNRDRTADPDALAIERQKEAVAAAAGVAAASAGVGRTSGTGTPRAKFLQTLQGKGAWDALIHGSFS